MIMKFLRMLKPGARKGETNEDTQWFKKEQLLPHRAICPCGYMAETIEYMKPSFIFCPKCKNAIWRFRPTKD